MEKLFVQIRADSYQKLRDLRDKYHLDVFRHTSEKISENEFIIDGLITPAEKEMLLEEGYRILMKDRDTGEIIQ